MGKLDGRVALVTGASRGIGRSIAVMLAKEGAKVALNYHSSEGAAREVADEIAGFGGTTMLIQADVSESDSARAMVKKVGDEWGQLDILVNNAGKFMPKLLADMTEAEFDRVMALHAKGPYFAMQEAAKVMKDGGRIVNISTAGTRMNFLGASVHLGSKAALEQYTKSLAQELAPRRITVNTVSPGITDTGVLSEQYRQLGVQLSPLKRLGLPKDIADVVALIVSEEARWLTGQNIHADGGIVM